MLPEDAVVSSPDFPDLQGRQGNGADGGAALGRLKFPLGLTAITQQHDTVFFILHEWARGGLDSCFGTPLPEQTSTFGVSVF